MEKHEMIKKFNNEFNELLKIVSANYKIVTNRDLERLFTKTQCGGPLAPRKMVANLLESYKRTNNTDSKTLVKFDNLLESVSTTEMDTYSYFVAPKKLTLHYFPMIY